MNRPSPVKPFTLIVCRQKRKLGDKYGTITETRISYATEANLRRAIERTYGAHDWQKATNNISYIFTYLDANKAERLMMYAYKDLPDTWKKAQLDLNEFTVSRGA